MKTMEILLEQLGTLKVVTNMCLSVKTKLFYYFVFNFLETERDRERERESKHKQVKDNGKGGENLKQVPHSAWSLTQGLIS